MGDIKYFLLMLFIFWVANCFCLMLMYPKALLETSSGNDTGTSDWQLGSVDSAAQFESLSGSFFASMNMMFGQFDLALIELALSRTHQPVVLYLG